MSIEDSAPQAPVERTAASVPAMTRDRQSRAPSRGALPGLGARALRLLNRRSYGFALLLAAVLLIVNILRAPGGFGVTDQLANYAPIALAAMASTPAIISGGGGFDLTISPLMTMTSGAFIVWLVPNGLGGFEAIPIVLALGAVMGAFNGGLIALLRVPPVVVTLSMYFILLGVDLLIVPNPTGLSGNWITHLAHSVGPVPGAVFTLAAPLVIWAALDRIPYRRTLYLVGSNDATAFSAGVNVALVRICAYALGGMFAGIGGLALTALVASVNASLASTYTLLAIASVALGGTSLWGGRGGLFGPALGAASIYLLQNLLTTLQVNPAWLQVVYGGMLVIAVVLVGAATRARNVT
jgi:ribose transport system permease protein